MRKVREGTRVLLVQTYIPEYRSEFFHLLRDELDRTGITLLVASGAPLKQDIERRDEDETFFVDFTMSLKAVRLGRRTVVLNGISAILRESQADFVIMEQAVKNVDSVALMLTSRLVTRHRIALWGHGEARPSEHSKFILSARNFVSKRADWFFAYTEAGASHMTNIGFDQSRITVVRNTLDERKLKADLEGIDDSEVRAFKRHLGISESMVGLFLGGIDQRKGISFLLQAVEEVKRRGIDFHLLVGGNGDSAEVVKSATARGLPVTYLGGLRGARKALALRTADVLAIPEWVGLVAIDSLIAGVPILTTSHHSHAPEFAYLEEERNCVVANHDVSDYATSLIEVLQDSDRLIKLGTECLSDSRLYRLDDMVMNFASGVRSWIESARAVKKNHP